MHPLDKLMNLIKGQTRARAQEMANDYYVTGRIGKEHWSAVFDVLSDPTRWSAKGAITKPGT